MAPWTPDLQNRSQRAYRYPADVTTSAGPAALWPAPHAVSPIDSTVVVPSSKSLTNRYLMLAALGSTQARLRRPLRARDTELMAAALKSLGTDIVDDSGDWIVTPRPWASSTTIECGLAGNVMRFVPAACGLATGRIEFDGDEQARTRPLAPLLNALRQLGVTVADDGRGGLPFAIEAVGHVPGGRAVIDSSASSQFISALLLAGTRYDHGLTVESVGPTVPSMPHIEMTMALLRESQIDVERPDQVTWHVPTGMPKLEATTVEPDLSNAMPFLAAALITGGRCRIPDWPERSVQPIGTVRELLRQLGGELEVSADGLEVRSVGEISGADLDLSTIGELVPTVTALATLANAPTRIRGVAHLRGHETNRLAALVEEYSALGADIQETPDGLAISPRPLHGGTFHTHHDHRMATAAALTGLAVPGIEIENVATTNKTMPDFPGLWHRMLGSSAA